MLWVIKYIRYVVLISSLVISGLIYVWLTTGLPTGILAATRLNQIYGLLALLYLYVALLASPLTQVWITMPGRGHYLRARRAIGVSAAYFALLHSTISFWGQLGGFHGLLFLNTRYLVAITLSFIALVILTTMALTAFNRVVSTMGYAHWKLLHRLVYPAGVLILIHALLLGSHFSSFTNLIPQITLIALILLLFLEALRIDRYITRKYPHSPQYLTTSVVTVFLVVMWLYGVTNPVMSIYLGNHHLPR